MRPTTQIRLNEIEMLLKKREVKKADILIAKHLRLQLGSLSHDEHAQLLILRAKARLLVARPEAAIDDLLKAKVLAPLLLDSHQNIELLADCYFAKFELSTVGFADRSDAQQSELLYRRLMSEYPNYENRGWVYYQLGRILLTSNQVDDAVLCLQQALLTPSHHAALTAYCYERLGFVAFYEQRNLSQSLMFLTKAVDTYPTSESRVWLVQVHMLRARVLREMLQIDQAIQETEQAIAIALSVRTERRSSLSEALLTAGELLTLVERREKDVITYLEQFLQITRRPLGIDVTWSRVYEMLGDAYFKVGRYDDAVAAYNSVVQFNPYHPWEISIYYRIGRAYYFQGNYAKSIEAIHHALQIAEADGHELDYHLYDIYGNAQFALKRYDKAAEAYATALQLAPSNSENLEKLRKYHQFSLEKLQSTP